MISRVITAVTLLLLLLNGCTAPAPMQPLPTVPTLAVVPTPTPSMPASPAEQYRMCVQVGGTEDGCQRSVWGGTFREDDPRWDCAWMGNGKCSPPPTPVTPPSSWDQL